MATNWTPERRAKQAALINRIKPWLTTTGPVTPEGKARSSKNGFKGNPRATCSWRRAAVSGWPSVPQSPLRPQPDRKTSHSTPAVCSFLPNSSLRRCSLAWLAAILASRSACSSARRRQASLPQGINDLLSDHIASSVDGSAAHASSKDWAARPNAPQPSATYAGRWQLAPASALHLIPASG